MVPSSFHFVNLSLSLSLFHTENHEINDHRSTINQQRTAMIRGDFSTKQPLGHIQKDLRLALSMSEICDHPIAITATTNEIYKHAKRLGYGEHDSNAVFIRSKF